jgi:hypothetical protein
MHWAGRPAFQRAERAAREGIRKMTEAGTLFSSKRKLDVSLKNYRI